MSFSSLTHRDRFILIFCLIFYFVRPITYDEVQERKLARLHKHHIEVVNVPSKSVGQPFLSNVKPSTINPSLNSYSHDEYKALMGREGEIILVAFRGKFLVEYKLGVDKKTTRLNANLRIVKKEPTNPAEELDVRASIPEDRILAKLYQIKPFGVNLPKEVDLNFARKLPTKPRIEYLVDKVGIKTVKDAHTAFAKHLDNDKTDVFFGQFGCNFEFENDDGSNIGGYKGLYAYNDNTKNMMFFREDPESETGYTLHSYMKLTNFKGEQLKEKRSLF